MNRLNFPYRYRLAIASGVAIILLWFSACSPGQAPQPGRASATPEATPTPVPSLPPAATASSTLTPRVSASPTLNPTATLTPSITPTPAPRPDFQTTLYPGVASVPYLKSPCQVIALRWDPQKSSPGTIVVPVMFHSIAKPDRPITDDTTVSEEYFLRFIERAHALGYETITSAQLIDFLQNNARIPARSLLMIVDDRKRAEFFDTYFIPYLKKYHWTVTNAWIAHPDTPAYLWKENEQFVAGGLVDFQAHGVIHNTPMDESVTEAYIRGEIFGPLQPMQDHFGKKPVAFIWPRGLFTPRAVQIAREAGYRVGFTVYARGPVLFNWVPQGAPELAAADPLLVLPRYWSTSAIAALEEANRVSTAAQAFYLQQRSADLAYYGQYCQADPPLAAP